MSNPFPECLGRNAAVAALLIGCALALPVASLAQPSSALPDPAAEFVELTADIEILPWGSGPGGSDGARPQSFQIHAIVGRNNWILEYQLGQTTNRCSFDGVRIVEQRWTPRTAQDPAGANPSVYLWSRDSESPDGNPGQTVQVMDHLEMVGRIAWLAFCSAPALNNPSHKLYPPWDFWKEYFPPATFVEKVSRFQDDLGLPASVLLLSGEHQPILDYRVFVTTNVVGWLFPQSFFLIEHAPTEHLPTGGGWKPQHVVHGKLTSIAPAANPLPPSKVVEPHPSQGIRFTPVPPSRIHIEGTSDVYDWSLNTTHIVGFIQLDHPLSDPSAPQTQPLEPSTLLASAEIVLPVRHFTSPYPGPLFSDQPDQAVLHRALKTTDHPNIIYRLHPLALTNAPQSEASAYLLQSTGELVIAGVTNPISMPVKITRQGEALKLSGSTSLKLSDFGIKPPSAEGKDWTIEVGDVVQTSFDLQFKRVEAP